MATQKIKRTALDSIDVTITAYDPDASSEAAPAEADALQTVSSEERSRIADALTMDRVIFNELRNATTDTPRLGRTPKCQRCRCHARRLGSAHRYGSGNGYRSIAIGHGATCGRVATPREHRPRCPRDAAIRPRRERDIRD